ncbi:TetR family transcriptional regulator [Arcticibacter pallidicorallinus]|uniref:TetR family transcriptional regulator n=1 Tax=Arcticibacter pallidicorallinus TaxID=1259464 RepID=A0A2T0TW35_9SPHI|nr:TetR/AcrR family transcriptional regulator [Arcticibacter pallidicorallinus]PRY49877.1 TetR family transcriptional regulator [Arcticibacter pallidicorallinus]
MNDIDRKRELIVESAIKRFSHFGIQKTTMNEIADDISVTQPSLYHYFPDKMSLVIAVVEKIMADYFEELEGKLATLNNLGEEFIALLVCRKKFIKRYFMLNLTETSPEAGQIQNACYGVMEHARVRESALVASLITKAIHIGEVASVDADKMSKLYLDAITGLSVFVLIPIKNKFSPGEDEFDLIFERQKELSAVFLSGLKSFGSDSETLL